MTAHPKPAPRVKAPRPLRRTTPVRRVSPKMALRIETRRGVRETLISMGFGYCEPARAGAPGACFGPLTLHHIWPSGRGGPDSIENGRIACAQHNTAMSQDTDTMAWATAHGFLHDAQTGPAFIAAGGRMA